MSPQLREAAGEALTRLESGLEQTTSLASVGLQDVFAWPPPVLRHSIPTYSPAA